MISALYYIHIISHLTESVIYDFLYCSFFFILSLCCLLIFISLCTHESSLYFEVIQNIKKNKTFHARFFQFFLY